MSLRALHYVLKVTDRTATVGFLRDVLGMHALRHEVSGRETEDAAYIGWSSPYGRSVHPLKEFEEGCKAACNGPYDGKWSKTMIG